MYSSSSPDDIGTLNVTLSAISFMSKTTLLWSLSSSQGNSWKEARITYNTSYNHKIVFEGSKGNGRGDIAIDDISFISTSLCDNYPESASPSALKTTITPEQTSVSTTPTRPTTTYSFVSQSEVDCDFNDGFCSWTTDPTTGRTWLLTNKPQSDNNGLIFD